MATGRENAVKAGREAGDVCRDVGKDSWCGLVVVGDLKQQHVFSYFWFNTDTLVLIKPTLVTLASDSSQIVKPAQSTSPRV